MNYKKGSFTTVPNKEQLRGKDAISQVVFMWLCSYSDDDGICFPSRTKLAKDCMVSTDTIDRKIRYLIDIGAIEKTIRKEGSINKSNLYQIVLIEDKNTKGVAAQSDQGSRTDNPRGSRTGHTVNSIHSELNSMNSKSGVPPQDIALVIEEFKTVNPSYKKWFGNKTQRASSERMIETHGLTQVIKVIGILPTTNAKKYFPSVTTPTQLEDKWAQLGYKLKEYKDSKLQTKGRGFAE